MQLLVANACVGLVAVLHYVFMYLETVEWTKPKGLRIFRQTLEQAQNSKVLAFNQGFYNGMLATGLVWGLVQGESPCSLGTKIFFLGCVTVAGILGGLTVSRSIFVVQAVPAIAGILLLLI